jgi:hypothetical protein
MVESILLASPAVSLLSSSTFSNLSSTTSSQFGYFPHGGLLHGKLNPKWGFGGLTFGKIIPITFK